MKRVGLVLPALPAYSETFFNLFIQSMKAADMQVVVFTDQPVERSTNYMVYSLPANKGLLAGPIKIGSMLRILILKPIPTFRLIFLNYKSGYTFKEQFKSVYLCTHLLQFRCDYYHFGYGTMAIHREHMAKAQRAQSLISFRGFDFYIFPLKHTGVYRRILPYIDKIHVLSNHMKATLIQEGINREIAVIPPAIEVPNDFVRNDIQLLPLHIITVARLHWIKGFTYIIDALSILKRTGISFKYTIAGDGPDRERMLFAIHQAGLQHEVSLLGKVNHSQIWELYQQHNLYIQYSHEEGFCNALLEAQAAGLICIASDAGGHLENIVNGVTGFIVPKRSPAQLADQILNILKMDPSWIHNISIAAQQRVREQFNIEIQKKQFQQLYNR